MRRSLPEHQTTHAPDFATGLAGEVLPPISWRTFRRDFLLFLALVVFLNISAYLFLGHYTSNYGFWVMKNKWRLLTNLQEPVDWLVLGDSSANQGVIPSLIEQEAGKTALNLGTIGNMLLVDDLWMLEEYINRFGPPEKVIIVHVYDMWNRSFDPHLLGYVPLEWGFWEDYALNEEVIGEEVEKDLLIERYFPLYTQNRSLSQILFRAITGFSSPFDTGYDLDQDGFFQESLPNPERVILGAEDHIRFSQENEFFISYPNQIFLQALARLAEEHKMDVYLMNSPVYEGLYQAEAYQSYVGDMHAALTEAAQESAYLHYIPDMKTFPAEQMQNPDHLIVSGAETYTTWLIDQLRNAK